MRTRCPVCNTVFRVTSEQLRVKAGKVRCGQCQSLFNAFDSLLDDSVELPPAPLSPPPVSSTAQPVEPIVPDPAAIAAEPAAEPLAVAAPEEDIPPPDEIPLPAEPETPEPAPAPAPADEAAVELPAPAEPSVAPEPEPEAAPVERVETIEESTLAAREAGLVAARELAETPAYNRWAAGTLSGGTAGGFDSEAAPPARWPFTLVAVLLILAFAGQLLHHFRTEVVQRWPDAGALFEAAAVDVPLPRNSELVSIESSDLQSDNGRGLLVLQATLRNRATYAQDWPVLELTLTDTRDTVVSRRILAATDYLPPGTDPHTFPANKEIGLRLWIEAKELGAAGYRLYVFYP